MHAPGPRLLALAGTIALAGCGGTAGARPADAAVPEDGRTDDGGPGDGGAGDGLLAGLPAPLASTTERFVGAETCLECHTAAGDALVDAAGRDVSPGALWPTSTMALSARDPYYLAAFEHELAETPAARATIEAMCTRCHAPAASVERVAQGAHLAFEALVAGEDPVARVGREGVTCTLCHQLAPEDSPGAPETFTGNYRVEDDGLIYGPHEAPFGRPMTNVTGFVPVHAPHVSESAFCASCHTVITRALDDAGAPVGPPFPEQVPYLEWRNSDYVDEGDAVGPRASTCQACHVPKTDLDGAPIETAISNRPPWLGPRAPVGRHVFRGGNAWLFSLVAAEIDWVSPFSTAAELAVGEAETEAFLRTAAAVTVEDLAADGDAWTATVRVDNRTGHKLPTGYPSRRMFLRVTVVDAAGVPLWRSGRLDAEGALVDAAGARLDGPDRMLPHRDAVTAEDEVAVWEARMIDMDDRPTHVLLRAKAFAKDTRLLPAGWSGEHADAAMTAPVGTEDDADFGPGGDAVRYRIPRIDGAAALQVELVLQVLPARAAESFLDHPGPMVRTFDAMRRRTPDRGRVVAAAEAPL